MGIYSDTLLPRMMSWALRDSITGRYRNPVCAGALGTVVEYGFGSGGNLSHYSDAVDRVLAVEPSEVAWQASAQARAQFGRPVERIGLDAAGLALDDDSADVVVSTWTLCTIPDLTSALAEARRVLRPGGQLRLVEHVLPDAQPGRALAPVLQPVWGRLAGGCHIDRDIAASISESGGRFAPLPSNRFLLGTVTWDAP